VKSVVSALIALTIALPAATETQTDERAARVAGQAKDVAAGRPEAESRYQIALMERLLEVAVEHGAVVTRDRLRAVLPPGDTLMSGENARVRGFRLEGYGVFFDVIVPSFETETTLAWSLRTLDQNALGLESALKALQAHVKQAGDVNLEQALKRIELQVNPGLLTGTSPAPRAVTGARNETGSLATTPDAPAALADPILNDPNEAYRSEVIRALQDAILDHSSSLGIGANEWLTIAAKGNDDRPRLAPADTDARTFIIRLKGSDLTEYLARQIPKEEALRRIEVRVF
jgi:hypothetical protein